MRDFRKYRIWQDAVSIANTIYGITDKFPAKETYAIHNYDTKETTFDIIEIFMKILDQKIHEAKDT